MNCVTASNMSFAASASPIWKAFIQNRALRNITFRQSLSALDAFGQKCYFDAKGVKNSFEFKDAKNLGSY